MLTDEINKLNHDFRRIADSLHDLAAECEKKELELERTKEELARLKRSRWYHKPLDLLTIKFWKRLWNSDYS